MSVARRMLMFCRFLKLVSAIMAPAVLLVLSASASAQIFIEDFDHPTGANGQVVFRGASIYLATGASPSGGDKNGNSPYLNGFVVQNNNFTPFSSWASLIRIRVAPVISCSKALTTARPHPMWGRSG